MKKEKYRDFTCQHVQKKQDKSIYIYHLIGRDLCICERCGAKLMKQVVDQHAIEKTNEALLLRNKYHKIPDFVPGYKQTKELKSIKESIKRLRKLR